MLTDIKVTFLCSLLGSDLSVGIDICHSHGNYLEKIIFEMQKSAGKHENNTYICVSI